MKKHPNTKHGFRNHPLYGVYSAMINRCGNPASKDYYLYGARGISVCTRWLDIGKFIEDMSPSYKKGLMLDRTNNSKGYSPQNCRWASIEQQNRNKRSNLVFKGECAVDATKRLGGRKGLIVMRVKRGWSYERAFSTPIKV